jgi:4'-phosphopantetheinyl transferase EntD
MSHRYSFDPKQILRRSSAIESLFPPGVVAFEARGIVPAEVLLSAERDCVARAVDKRVQEFAAGRLCARAGLAELGFAPAPLLPGPGRLPLWPGGSVGSISHFDQFSVAVVAHGGGLVALGVDAERIDGLGTPLWRLVMRPEEYAWVNTLEPHMRVRMATLLFSAKEAFYKCQYALTGKWLDFGDVKVEVVGDTFNVTSLRKDILPEYALSCGGRFRIEEDMIVTGLAVRAFGSVA